jgi:hypothetical protein
MRHIVENGQHYVIREGRRIPITTIPDKAKALKAKTCKPLKAQARKPFKVRWIRFPMAWHETLRRANSAGTTYDLAITILAEAFKRERVVSHDVVLSAMVTRMSKNTRIKATKELVKLGLIELHRAGGNQAYRVSLFTTEKNRKNRKGTVYHDHGT